MTEGMREGGQPVHLVTTRRGQANLVEGGNKHLQW